MGFKFNYSLQEVVQNFRSFHMFVEFDRTVKWLTIHNRKPVDHTEHVLEADPETINQIREGNFMKMAKKERCVSKYGEPGGFTNE